MSLDEDFSKYDQNQLTELIKTEKQYIFQLEMSKARFGFSVPPHIAIELEDRNKRLAKLQEALGKAQAGTPSVGGDGAPLQPEPNQVIPLPAVVLPSSQQVTVDFELAGNGVRVVWRNDLIGRKETQLTPPFDDTALPVVIRALDVIQYPNYPTPNTTGEQRHFSFSADEQAILQNLGLWADNRVVVNAHEIVGGKLYEALGPDGRNALEVLQNKATADRLTTNYVLRFPKESVSVAALPWEALWNRGRNQAILIRGRSVDSCVRYIDDDAAIPPPLAAGSTLRVLALSPVTGIPDPIRQEERTARLATWDALKSEGQLTYDELSPCTMRALNDYLLDHDLPDIVHYYGHGVYRDGMGYLVFDGAQGGKELVSSARLATALGDVRLVVIYACQSAMVDEDAGLLTGVAPAISMWAGAVVAMQLTVRMAAATRFAEVFYRQLLGKNTKRSLQEAVAQARRALFIEASDGASWYVPTLYIRTRDLSPVHLVQ